jgi:hypothetical protein
MKIQQEEFEHPTQASRVVINVFAIDGDRSPVHGLDAARRGAGFLVTEDRIGVSTVIATLGAFETREQAVAAAEKRGQELLQQRYRPAIAHPLAPRA